MMKHYFRYITLIVLTAALLPGARAQKTGATATLDSTHILIGSQLNLTLELTVPKGSKVNWPMFADTVVAGVEVLRSNPIDTVTSEAGYFTLQQKLLITSFDSGYYAIRPIPFQFRQAGDSTRYYTETATVYLEVSNPEVDLAGDIKPIKPPLRAPITFAEVLPYLLAGLLLVVLIAGIYYYLNRKKKHQPVFQIRPKPKLPPHQVALAALETLRQKKLWQSGRVKDYYSELTDITRLYIEDRFQIPALEMTSYEIGQALRKTDVAAASREKLSQVLESADLVKFAKAQPLPLENDNNLSLCAEFVRETKPVVDLRQEADKETANTEIEGKS